jgi:hypothetical protein
MMIMNVTVSTTTLIAQESVAANAQIDYVFQQVLTPIGASLTLLGLIFVITALLVRRLMWAMAFLSLLCVMFQLHPDALTVNILLPPLQSFRFISKSLAFVLMCIAVLGVFQLPRLLERGATGPAAYALLAFQLLYTVELLLFTEEGLSKGLLGLISMSSMLIVFGVGFGRLMIDAISAQRCFTILVWVSVLFVAINLLQIAADVKGAFVGGRLTGICGNAQTLAAVAASRELFRIPIIVIQEPPKVGFDGTSRITCLHGAREWIPNRGVVRGCWNFVYVPTACHTTRHRERAATDQLLRR